MMYRQGDVLVELVERIPCESIIGETLLVRGEGRNHGHFIKGSDLDIIEADENESDSFVTHYLDVRSEALLEHLLIDSATWTGEHAPIAIPPGKYRVIKQREYDPYARAIRAVRD
jgi:hypothetical protein